MKGLENGNGEGKSFCASIAPLLHVSDELIEGREESLTVDGKTRGSVAVTGIAEAIVCGMGGCSIQIILDSLN